ncbi:hypothetical protein C8R47DRAFT_1149844 [Mycena vitilis]|nr:hypothetical protein C8R47DRAFT_1149844 [Mycena vitilis]
MWVKHGGSLTHSKQDFYQAKAFFCDGPDDPWVKELLSRSLIVRHACWISKSVSEQFAVPVSKYVIDDQFDPSKIAPAAPLPQGIKPTNTLARKPLTPNRPLVASREEFVLPVKHLKRALGSENRDESSVELDSRPLKKARIEPNASPVSRTQQPALPAAPIPLFPTRAAHTIYYPSPANSSPPKTPDNSRPRLQADLRRIDFTIFNPTPALPLLSFARPRPLCRRAANPRPNTNDRALQPYPSVTHSPRPTIAALLRNPRADACVFAVSEMYRDKVFSAVKISLVE